MRGTIALSLLLASALAIGQHAMQQGESSNGYDSLTAAVEHYDIAVMFDLPNELSVVPFENLDAASWLAMTAAANDRVVVEIGGTYVLIRPDRPPGSPGQGDRAEVLSMLNRLSDVHLRDLLAGRLTLGDLSVSDRSMLRRNMLNWNGTSSGAWDRKAAETYAMHAEAGGGSLLKLSLGAKYTAKLDPEREYTTYDYKSMLSAEEEFRQVPILNAPVTDGGITHAVTGLVLDFGTGEALTIAELLRRANDELGRRYRIDGRILDDSVFVSGSYDVESFDAAVDVLLKLRQLQNAPAVEEVLAIAEDQFLERVRSLAEDGKIIEPETISLTELGARDEHTARKLADWFGLSGDHDIRVRQGFMITLRAGDSMPIGSHQAMLDGKPHTIIENVSSNLSILF